VAPNVKGQTLSAARAALARAHCRLGTARQSYSAKVKKGRVISQTPAPGARRADRTDIAVVVSRGPRR
jgi:beta-lactam-binding protein with PASTA domain